LREGIAEPPALVAVPQQRERRMAPRTGALRVVDSDSDEHDYQANLDDVREFAQSLPERFLYCREMGHNWKPFSAGRYKDGGFERVLRCTRCRCRRIQSISSRGLITASHYEHPEGYLLKGMGHIWGEGRGVLRLESIARIVPRDLEE
jgi:hypothetical protein